MMMFDEWQNGVPIAFIVIGKSWKNDLHLVLQSLSQRMSNDWMSFAIIVDNTQAKINILK
jgi:hypothetical protein